MIMCTSRGNSARAGFGALLAACASIFLYACSSSNDDRPPADDPLVDRLTEDQRTTLPDDCLIALDELDTAYCFSVATREFMAVLPEGVTQWRFVLPGSDAQYHLEGVEFVAGQLIIVADTTTAVGPSSHEISRFERGGEFIDTQPILEPFRRLRGDASKYSPAWDLDGEDLLIVADDDALYVGAVDYQLMAGGDSATRTDWVRTGASITRVDPANGARLAYRRFPNALIEHIALADAD